jgi:sugar phosphate permease
MSAFGLYVQPLEADFGWTRAETSLAISLAVVASGLAAPLVGHWTDVRGARSSIVAGGLLCGLSFLLLASTHSLLQFYAFYSLHAFSRQMMSFIPFQAMLAHWFSRRRGVALSILGTGFSLGGLVVLPVVAAVIGVFGWRGGYLFSGALMAGTLVPIGLLVVRNRPSDLGQHLDEGTEDEAVEVPDAGRGDATVTGMTLQQAAHTPLFWICGLGFMLLFFGMIGWQVHQIPFYESRGISSGTAALIVSLSAGASILARLGMGVVADHFERFETVVVILLGLLAASMITLLISTWWPAIGLYLLLWVVGASAGPMVESLVLIKAFGVRHFGSILGAIVVIETAGEALSPGAAGTIYDHTGSYNGALAMFAIAFSIGLVLFLIASRMQTPLHQARLST